MGSDLSLSADQPGSGLVGLIEATLRLIPPLQQFIVAVSASKSTFGVVVALVILALGVILARSKGYTAMAFFAVLAICLIVFVFVFASIDLVPGPVKDIGQISYIGHPKDIKSGDLKAGDFVTGSFTREPDGSWLEVVGAFDGQSNINRFKLVEENPAFIILEDADHEYCPTRVLISLADKKISSKCYQQADSKLELLYVITEIAR